MVKTEGRPSLADDEGDFHIVNPLTGKTTMSKTMESGGLVQPAPFSIIIGCYVTEDEERREKKSLDFIILRRKIGGLLLNTLCT